MLQAVRDLFPFFVAFYLLDAFRYLGATEYLFVARLAIGARLRTAGLRLGALLPGDREFCASGLPLPVTPEGAFLPRTTEASGTGLYDSGNFALLRYDELSLVEAEHHTLVINGTFRLKLPSSAHARSLMERLGELRDLPEVERRERLEKEVFHSLDLEAVEERRTETECAVELLTWLCWLLFVGLFVAVPAVAYFEPAAPWIGGVLLSVAVVHLAVLLTAARAAQRIGRGRVGGTRGVWWAALLFPPSAVRVAATLRRSVFYDFDHLAVAAALLPEQGFLQRAAVELHCARFAARADGDESWRSYWKSRLEGVEKLLEMAGSSAAEALAPPAPQDPTAASYCPVCGGEYRQLAACCDSCAIQLVAFDSNP